MSAGLQAIQGRCLRAVARAYRASSTEALEIETNVEPLDLYTGRLAAQATVRYKLSKAYQGIKYRLDISSGVEDSEVLRQYYKARSRRYGPRRKARLKSRCYESQGQ